MPKRTIKDAFFPYIDTDGRRQHAQRGETVDVPKGDDLERGDRLGAFTDKPGDEPEPLEGSYIPDIEVDWDEQEFKRWVDAGTTNEIIDKLNEVAPSDRARVAQSLIQAEHSRGETARGPLLEALAAVASGAELEGVSAAQSDEGSEPQPEDLNEFVASNTVEAVIARATENPELAPQLLEAEQARGDAARKGVTDALAKTGS